MSGRFSFDFWRRKGRDLVPEGPPPLSAELLGLAQLDSHGRNSAAEHDVDQRPGRELMLARLQRNETIIRSCHELVEKAAGLKRNVAPAAQWLLDNFHLIEEQIALAREHLPPSYSRELPRLKAGSQKGFPRIYDLIYELVSHTDGAVDMESLTTIVRSYQAVKTLRLGELWAVPIMLRLTLIESLSRVSQRIEWRRRQRDNALAWAGRFLKKVREEPNLFIVEFAEFVKAPPTLSHPFISELTVNIEGVHLSLGMVIHWLEQVLSEQGQTLDLIQQAESQAQAADQISMGNTVASLRSIAAIDWKKFVAEFSVVEAVLSRDPSGAHAAMDFVSRDRYRHVIEKLARKSGLEEELVAETAVRMAWARREAQRDDLRRCHVGYYLAGEGRAELMRELGCGRSALRSALATGGGWSAAAYVAAAFTFSALFSSPFVFALYHALPGGKGMPAAIAVLAFAVFIALSRPAVALLNWIVTGVLPPKSLPRMDFSKGIPDDHRTAVIIPTLLSDEREANRLIGRVEVHYLANRSRNLVFCLLTDFPDACEKELPGEREVLEKAVEGVRRLNSAYSGDGTPVFTLFHRPRQWNPSEGVWMGLERKRGKIEAFNRLVLEGDAGAFSRIEGGTESLRGVRYAITLDTDTQLPPESAWKLVGTMAHPLNRPEAPGPGGLVTRGYGILQPRIGVALTAAQRSAYARLLSGEVGLDPYTREVSNLYHDLFGQGQFIGKGIYDIKAFHAALEHRFPENRILSHDLIEGCYARCGFVNDVELLEESPSRYGADSVRRRRWVRGDWQIAAWLLPQVKAGRGAKAKNPLPLLCRWMIFDNLRRSLCPAAALASFFAGVLLFAPPAAFLWCAAIASAFFLPHAIRAAPALMLKGRLVPWGGHMAAAAGKEGGLWAVELLDLAVLPHQAVIQVSAAFRALWRVGVSKRRLLEWKTAADAEASARFGWWRYMTGMWPCLAAAAAMASVNVFRSGALDAAVLPFSMLWLLTPTAAWLMSRPTHERRIRFSESQDAFIRRLARRTWGYFERFAVEEENWLPPDNFQERPHHVVAHRTSPTNIGLALLSDLAAYDFGYLSAGRLLQRVTGVFSTLGKLDRHRGHFYNWYDTVSLRPLHPLYVSTVDSGNLAISLMVLKQGLLELRRHRLLPARWRQGLLDTAEVLLEELRKALREGAPANLGGIQAVVNDVCGRITRADGSPGGACVLLAQCRELLEKAGAGVSASQAISFWMNALAGQCGDLREDLLLFAPWLEGQHGEGEAGGPMAASLSEEAGLEQILRLASLASAGKKSVGKKTLSETAGRVGDRMGLVESLAQRCEEFADMDMEFLYDPAKRLLVLGFNAEIHQKDNIHYDLLASEARLSSFFAVARGALPLEHWFHLGRQLAPGSGPPVLISWSGSMFEYLMPRLLLPSFRGTLLDAAEKGAVRRQILYGRSRGVPWGISESCYNLVDAQMTYQYRAFGVPGLGLKRGLRDDLVVAPYASALALCVAPEEACANLADLAERGCVGSFGLYEAVDFTPSRLQQDERSTLVACHMAHHGGMALLSFACVLLGRPMQRRLLADPQFRTASLLLQEKVPVAGAVGRMGSADGGDRQPLSRGQAAPAARVMEGADNPVPEVFMFSNGRYSAMVTHAGGGYSRWNQFALTRWREDLTRDAWGSFIYLCDVESGRFWSPTRNPVGEGLEHYRVIYSQGLAEFHSGKEGVIMKLDVAVSPEEDVEVRRLTITNVSGRRRALEITTFSELVLADPRAELSHPAFNGLFIQTEVLPDRQAILAGRRKRSPDEPCPWFFHFLYSQGASQAASPSFETDRLAFLGRGRSAANPVSLDRPGALSGGCGAVVDPAAAIRLRLDMPEGGSVTAYSLTGVGEKRDEALRLADKYLDPRMAERVFSLSWTHSQVLLHQIGVQESDAQLFGMLAGSVLYANPAYRAKPSVLIRNTKPQSALWSYGISGDLPIILVRISDEANLDLARSMILAHCYWRHKGLRVDLVIWTEAFSGYRQSLLDAVIGLVNAGPEAKSLNQPGGIFVRSIEQLPEEDRILFQAASRVILDDRRGTLSEHVERRHSGAKEAPVPLAKKSRSVHPQNYELPPRDLRFFNGLGGFTADGREYVTILQKGGSTPAPWVNVLANPDFGSVVSESGGAYTWFQNAHEFRLTPWHNDPVSDLSGEAFYVRDEETGRFWSPSPAPARGPTPYVCRHGLGYSVFEHTQDGVFTELYTYVGVRDPVKYLAFTIRNLTDRPRRISVTGFCEWVLGESRDRNAMHIISRLDPQTGALVARNVFNNDFGNRQAFFHCSHAQRTLCADRTEFIGRNSGLTRPAAMLRTGLSNRILAGADPCAAMQAVLELAPNGQEHVVFMLGAALGEEQIRSLIGRSGGPDGARGALEEVWDFWKHQLGAVYVATPDPAVNHLANHWLTYQVLASRMWGRSGYYQSGGAYGFRDQLQDSLAMLAGNAHFTREQILKSASRQFPEGDVQHWWHPPSGRGVRTTISDDYLWLPYAACLYVEATGDSSVLSERIPFLHGRILSPGEDSCYDLPQLSEHQAELYEHCARAVSFALRFGAHGLPLMGGGDWNDGMNRLGAKGKGESVWLAFFLYRVLVAFSPIAASRGDRAFEEKCRNAAAELRGNIESACWDGDWYLRAFDDEGGAVGSSENSECAIDSIAQSWAVMSDAADPGRARRAMNSLYERLVDRKHRLVRLFAPPFDSSPGDPGYIKGYLPGVRENGGQYTHAAAWAAIAFAKLGDAEKAWEIFDMINPIGHGDNPEKISLYRVEPYVMPGDVYTAKNRVGQGGWTWYTGAAGWTYQLLIRHLLGLHVAAGKLFVRPLMRPDWNGYAMHYRHFNTFYHISVRREETVAAGSIRVTLNGAPQEGDSIELVDDGVEKQVVVEVAPAKGP